MSVVVGENNDGSKEDAILIPENENDNKVRRKKGTNVGVSLIIIGLVIAGVTGIVWATTWISYCETAGPILWIIIGILLFFHGLLLCCQPPKTYDLDVTINGKSFGSELLLRKFLVSTINIIFGVITMCTVGTHWCSDWNIIGLVLSILLIFGTIASHVTKSRMIKQNFFENSAINLEQSVSSTGKLLAHQVELVSKLLPLPSIHSLTDLKKLLKEPRLLTNKPVHLLSILLAMVTCLVMFSAQLWDMAITECDAEACFGFADPTDTFARNYFYGIIIYQAQDRKLVILISTTITFLLCTTLLLLMRNTTTIRMFLSGILSLGVGIFFFLFSIDAVRILLMLGANMSELSFILKLVSLMPVSFLATLFFALSYSNIIQTNEEKETSSNFNTCSLRIITILAILFFFLSMVTMVSSNFTAMSTVQEHWNTSRSFAYDKECRNESRYNNYGYNRHYDTTNTTAPPTKPEKCYLKELDRKTTTDFDFFSVSQLLLTESILFLAISILTTGRRLTRKAIFVPGLFIFAAAVATIIAFFSGIFHYDLQTNGFPFLILNSVNTISALIVGLFCVVAGGSAFISFIEFISRIILSIVVFAFIISLTFIEILLKLTSLISKVPEANKEEEKPEETTA